MAILSLITHNTDKRESLELVEFLQSILSLKTDLHSIRPYSKDGTSYNIKIEMKPDLVDSSYQIHQMIKIADQIVSPWLTYYDKKKERIKLKYLDSNFTQKRYTICEIIKSGTITY